LILFVTPLPLLKKFRSIRGIEKLHQQYTLCIPLFPSNC
jgi:hypothetical protein